ncbi:MAG: hypothetical protein P4L40_00140 [Terracidiphilus sp.]|nr:hypothetical protein [Terracidiphilus sp.]
MSDKSLDKFRQEYEKLHQALKKVGGTHASSLLDRIRCETSRARVCVCVCGRSAGLRE